MAKQLKSIKFPGLDDEYIIASVIEDDELLECLTETDMVPMVSDSDGAILTDENGKVILM